MAKHHKRDFIHNTAELQRGTFLKAAIALIIVDVIIITTQFWEKIIYKSECFHVIKLSVNWGEPDHSSDPETQSSLQELPH